MLQLTTTLSGTTTYIDLFDGNDFELNLSFAEIQDITKRNSTFSKSFNVPGSKNNNNLLEHFYNINSSYTNFDLSKKLECKVLFDGYVLMEGYLRLNNVAIVNKQITYNLTFYSEFGNLVATIGDKLMRELNLDNLLHTFDSPEIILDSLKDPDICPPAVEFPYNNGDTYWLLANYGYEYNEDKTLNDIATPLLDFKDGATKGFFDYIGTPVQYYYFKPSVSIKELYSRIFQQAGFQIDSKFFDTAYFGRYYLPLSFNPDGLYFLQGEETKYQFSFTGNPVNSTGITWTDTTLPTDSFQRLQINPAQIDNTGMGSYSNFSFKPPVPGVYKMRVSLEGYNSELVPDTINLSTIFNLRLHEITTGNPNGTSGSTLFSSYFVTLAPGAGGSFGYDITFYASDNVYYALDLYNIGIGTFVITNLFGEIYLAPKNIIGDFNYSEEFPPNEFKQIDFIKAVNTMFNLVMVPSNENEKTIIVEPVIDYIGKGNILDWTPKVDRNQLYQISPTTTIINGSINFNFEQDQDFGNTEYNKSNNLVFGTRRLQLNTDYKDENTEFNTQFGTLVDYTLNNPNRPNITLPYYFITKEEDNDGISNLFFNPFKTLPRVLFRGTNLPSKNVGFVSGSTQFANWYLDDVNINMFPVNNRFITYPFSLSGFSHYTNYNSRDRFDQLEYNFSDYEDLYDVYYKDYIEDLTSPDSRILDCSVYLFPEEIKMLRFNEKILIDGNYFRINKISGYKANSDEPVKVQLIKLTKDYRPHRVAYFDLLSCTGSTQLHTNTDLTFGMWNFVGNNFLIDGTCYQVVRGEYNPNYTYQPITTTYSGNSFVPLVYTDCGCNIPISEVDISQDVLPTPEPTPPFPTPTPTPTAPSDRLYYIATKCSVQQQILCYSTAPLVIGSVVGVLPPFSEVGEECYIIVSTTTIVNNNPVVASYIDCDACTGVVPITPSATATRTPTPTPTFTPTPSSTPNACVEVQVFNESFESLLTFNWSACDMCDGVIISEIPPRGLNTICACPDSVSIISGEGTISEVGYC
jgi:hypothetical protein